MLHSDERKSKEAENQKAFRDRNPEYQEEWKRQQVAKETEAERCIAVSLCIDISVLLSSNVALIGGNSTKPGSSYYALIKAVLSLLCPLHVAKLISSLSQ